MPPRRPIVKGEPFAFYERALTRTRLLTEAMLQKLESDMQKGPSEDDKESEWWWGAKENRMSALTKLSQLLLKLIPAEQALRDDAATRMAERAAAAGRLPGTQFTDADFDIIERFLERRRQQQIKMDE